MRTYVYGTCLMRDEADFLPYQLKNCLNNKLDGLIISDIMSRDGSRDILEEWKGEFGRNNVDYVIIDEKQFGYFQAIKFNGMARMAAERTGVAQNGGARLMVQPFDCDELWSCPQMPLGDFLRANPIDFWWTSMRTMISTSADDPNEKNPTKRIRHFLKNGDARDEISPVKVIYRWGPEVWLELGAHRTRMANMDTLREDGGKRGPLIHHERAGETDIVFRHYPARSLEQYIRKVRNNAAAMDANPEMKKSSANRHSVERGKMTDEELKVDFMKNHFEADAPRVTFDSWKGIDL